MNKIVEVKLGSTIHKLSSDEPERLQEILQNLSANYNQIMQQTEGKLQSAKLMLLLAVRLQEQVDNLSKELAELRSNDFIHQDDANGEMVEAIEEIIKYVDGLAKEHIVN
jgi:flagellar biosynthesis chaperone FliJ